MPKFNVDLTVANVVPDDDYLCEIKKADSKTYNKKDKNSGQETGQVGEYINWQLRILNGKNTGDKFAGRSVFHMTNLEMGWLVKAMLDAADVSYTKDGFETDPCIGKQIWASINAKDDPQRGPQNVVNKVWKP